MSRRKDRGDLTPVPVLFGMIVVAVIVLGGVILYGCLQSHAKAAAQPAPQTPTQATTPATPPEATKPVEEPKTEEEQEVGGKPMPPKNPCSWLYAEVKKGMTAKEFDALYERANMDNELQVVSEPYGWNGETRRVLWREWDGNAPNESSQPKWAVAVSVWFGDGKVRSMYRTQWQQQNWSEEAKW